MSIVSSAKKIGSNVMDSGVLGKTEKALLIISTPPPPTRRIASTALALRNVASKSLGGDVHRLEVKYNPSTIQITGNCESVPFQCMKKNLDASIPNQNIRPPSVVLEVTLIFDDENNQDAFMADKFKLPSVGSAVTTVSTLYKNLFRNGYTVQPQTNGIVAVPLRESTNTVAFIWADMMFVGVVSEITANYSMFSISGKPIRSDVFIRITQDIQKDGYRWNDAFDKCFGDEDIAKTSGGKGRLGSFTNLMNVQF